MLRLCKWLRGSRSSGEPDRKELERTTDIFFSDMSNVDPAQGDEACMTDGDKFVATTAKFTDDWDILPLEEELRPKNVNPQFHERRNLLCSVAQSTCYIGVRSSSVDGNPISGTAFFVAPTILLTVGHMVKDKKSKVVAQIPGTRKARLFVQDLFDTPRNPSRFETFECQLLESGRPNVDISILQVKGNYKSPHWIKLEGKKFLKDDAVDVVGYPGDYPDSYVRQMMHGGVVDHEDVESVNRLFPKCQLIASHGLVASGGNQPRYHVSTVIGMSGSPVILKGKVVGVHSGAFWEDHERPKNQCVAFSWGEAAKLLSRYELVAPAEGSGYSIGSWHAFLGQRESAVNEYINPEGSPPPTRSRTQTQEDDDRMTQSTGPFNPF